MKSRRRPNSLRDLISEDLRRTIREVGEKEKPDEPEDSLDAEIDRYLSSYEAESKSAKNEGKDFRMLVRRFLSEAEDDEEKEEKPEDEKEGEEGEEEKPEEPEKLKLENIDVENFVNSVMRLVDNYDSLLDFRNVILKRAVNFLNKGYESAVADAFKDTLLDTHGIEIGKSKSEVEADEYEAPAADRAGTSPGA